MLGSGTKLLTRTSTWGDGFLVKLDSNGSKIWAQQIEGTGDVWTLSVTTVGTSDVFVSGYFAGQAKIGTQSPTSLGGSYDAYVARVNPTTGAFDGWVKTWGGSDTDQATTVIADGQGHLYVGGTFNGSIRIDSTTAGSPFVLGSLNDAVGPTGYIYGETPPPGTFIAQLDTTTGNADWASATGATTCRKWRSTAKGRCTSRGLFRMELPTSTPAILSPT